MGHPIITEAQRRPAAPAQGAPGQARPPWVAAPRLDVSRERANAPRNKKNAGKRPRQGG